MNAKYQATQRASAWLQDRIRELRDQASAAERAVVKFKTKNNIVTTGRRREGRQADERSAGVRTHQSIYDRPSPIRRGARSA